MASKGEDRNALIVEAFKAHEGAPSWKTDEEGRDAAIRWHMRGFNDALALFEQAHTPTDSEREAYLPADVYNRLMAHLMAGGREGLLLAGEVQSLTGASALRRRPVQGEYRCRHEACEIDSAGNSTRCADCGKTLSPPAARFAAQDEPSEHFHLWSGYPCKADRCLMEPQVELPTGSADELEVPGDAPTGVAAQDVSSIIPFYDEKMQELAAVRTQDEPAEHRDRVALAEFIDKALDGDAGAGAGAFLAGGILGFLANRTARHAAFDSQDETSGAQTALASIQGIVDTYAPEGHKYAPGYPISDIRAALRAAAAAPDQGGEGR